MTQLAKVVEITSTFVPVDPNAFPDNLGSSGREDYPIRSAPIVAYEGFNFMPTPYGYKSYFGTNAKVGIDALASRVDRVFVIQTSALQNKLVALCEDGIWTKVGDSSGAWTHAITLTTPAEGVHYNWSTAVISGILYAYRADSASVYKFASHPVYRTQPTTAIGALTVSAVLAVTGSLVVADTYTYTIAVKDANGDVSSVTSSVVRVVAAPSFVTLSWAAVVGAAGYRIYRTSLLSPTPSYVDVGLVTTYVDKGYITGSTVLPDTVTSILYNSYEPQPIVPTFLNMTAQQGIFKAIGRLGFWDSDGSIAWSSLDDTGDFVPSITTLAGSAIFESVNGSIVTILPHGEGFTIYATKSIVHINQDLSATFQWNPTVLLTSSGVAFPEEVCVSNPDTTHFAYTNTGLYKIEGTKIEPIIPEVTDYLKGNTDPVFLKMLEGRYLFLQFLNNDYIDGQVLFSESTVPALRYLFPGSVDAGDLIPGVTLTGVDVCSVLNAIGEAKTVQQQAAANALIPDKKPGTTPTPVWTAYLSNGLASADSITWGSSPVATVDPNGVEKNHCPVGNVGKTTDNSHVTVTGAAAYSDHHWTLERFIAVQSAIWEQGDKSRSAFISAIGNRASTGTKVSASATNTNIPLATDEATIGRYTSGTTGPILDYSMCMFRMTRYIDRAVDLKRVKTNQTTSAPAASIPATFVSGTINKFYVTGCGVGGTNPTYGHQLVNVSSFYEANTIASAACAAATTDSLACAGGGQNWPYVGLAVGSVSTVGNNLAATLGSSGGTGSYMAVALSYSCPTGYTLQWIGTGIDTTAVCMPNAAYQKTEVMNAYNKTVPIDITPIAQTGYAVITGWEYTAVDNTTKTVAAGICDTSTTPPTATTPTNSVNGVPAPPVVGNMSGSVCSIPFETVTLPDIQADPIIWPDQTVTLEGGSFLLQNGSTGPIYPTFQGALVYDLQLKKWGKLKLQYKQLLDYSPINSNSGNIIPVATFGLSAGAMKADGYVYLFDEEPSDSHITYGKIGYYRLGYTDLEEVRIQFKTPSTGLIATESSLDGRNLEVGISKVDAITDETSHTLFVGTSARWHNIKVSGKFDITNLEYTGFVSGRR